MDRMLGFHPYFDIRHNKNGRIVSPRRRPHFTPKEISWYLFLSEAVWTPRYLNADRLDQLKIFTGPAENRARALSSCGAMPQPTAPPTPFLKM